MSLAANLRRLEGKVAIITGGASGIGEATARLFASHGASIIIADIQHSLALSVANSIPKCTFIPCDVRDELQLSSTITQTIQTHNRLDIMFSNAGIFGPSSPLLDLNMSQLDNLLAVHVRGMASAIKHAGRAMVSAGIKGSIICTGSVAGVQAGVGPVGYTVAKHAVLGLVKAAAGELGGNGVRVNCVSPFGVATPLGCEVGGKTVEEFEEMVCESAVLKGKVLRAADVAAAALFLASDDSAFISGQNIVVDGGVTGFNKSVADWAKKSFANLM